jgi:hydroxymethylpyrimidine pyrophosphatase-like HAD family hydrolase
VTISEPLAAKLKHHTKPVWVIHNGFDPDDLIGIEKIFWPIDTLNVVYTGSVYPEHHDVDGFFAGLSLFKQEDGFAKVRVVGRNVAPFIDAAKRWNVTDFVKVETTVERHVALSMQCSADVLLFFIWEGGDKGIYTTKLFEYAGAQRPILVVGEELSDVSGMLRSAGIGYVASGARSVADHLHAWTLSKKNEGPMHFQKSVGYDFSRRNQFTKLEALMQGLLVS